MDRSITAFWPRLKNFGELAEQEARCASSMTDKQIVALCYFLKIQNTIRSIMILLDCELVFDARILTRTLFETMIYLRALAKDEPQFSERYLKDWVERRGKHYRDLRSRAEGIVDEAEKKAQLKLLEKGRAITRNMADTIPPEILKERFGLKVGELSKKFGFGEQYLLFYQNLHDVVHSLPPAVVPHYKKGVGFTSYPAGYDSDLAALVALWFFLFSIEDIIDTFGLHALKGRFDEVREEWEENEAAYGERVRK